jgi:Tfp pilus assembly protein PilN
MVCVVILLAALGTVGYLLYQSHSGKMEAESKRLAAEKQLEEEKARTTAAEAAKAKQERENRLAIAQSLRDSFAARAGVSAILKTVES